MPTRLAGRGDVVESAIFTLSTSCPSSSVHAATAGRAVGSLCQHEVMSGPRRSRPARSRSAGRCPVGATSTATFMPSYSAKGVARCASSQSSKPGGGGGLVSRGQGAASKAAGRDETRRGHRAYSPTWATRLQPRSSAKGIDVTRLVVSEANLLLGAPGTTALHHLGRRVPQRADAAGGELAGVGADAAGGELAGVGLVAFQL